MAEKRQKFTLSNDDLVRFIEDLGLILEVKYLCIPEILAALETDFEGNKSVNVLIDAIKGWTEERSNANLNLGMLCKKAGCFPPFCVALLKFHDDADSARLGKVLRHYAKILERRMREEEKRQRGKD